MIVRLALIAAAALTLAGCHSGREDAERTHQEPGNGGAPVKLTLIRSEPAMRDAGALVAVS